MKKNTTMHMLVAAAIVLAASTGFAAQAKVKQNYVSVSGKYTMMGDMDVTDLVQVDSDDGYGFGAAIGTRIENFKIEAEIATQKSDISAFEIGSQVERFAESGDTRIDTAMINAFIDVPLGSGLSFYAGGGAGGAIVTISLYDIDSDDTVFAYKLAAGFSYNFTPDLGADLGYEYLATEDVELDTVEVTDISSNNIVLAFKYMF